MQMQNTVTMIFFIMAGRIFFPFNSQMGLNIVGFLCTYDNYCQDTSQKQQMEDYCVILVFVVHFHNIVQPHNGLFLPCLRRDFQFFRPFPTPHLCPFSPRIRLPFFFCDLLFVILSSIFRMLLSDSELWLHQQLSQFPTTGSFLCHKSKNALCLPKLWFHVRICCFYSV